MTGRLSVLQQRNPQQAVSQRITCDTASCGLPYNITNCISELLLVHTQHLTRTHITSCCRRTRRSCSSGPHCDGLGSGTKGWPSAPPLRSCLLLLLLLLLQLRWCPSSWRPGRTPRQDRRAIHHHHSHHHHHHSGRRRRCRHLEGCPSA